MTQPLGSCPGCGGEESFEQVHPGPAAGGGCPDQPGECPEWVCAGCGAGVFLGLVTTAAADPAPIRASSRAA